MVLKSFSSLVFALVCSTASAQVYRCTDPATKAITFSDAPCVGGKQVARKRTAEELSLDAERADISRQRTQLANERDAMRRQQAQAPAQTRSAPSQPAIDPVACQRAKRELSIASNIKTENTTTRMNRAIIEVNMACGTKTELIQEPDNIHINSGRGPMTCHGTGATMFCN